MKLGLALALLLLASTAQADIVEPPPNGQRWLEHFLVIENMKDFPGFVIIAHDPAKQGTIAGDRAFHAGTEARQLLISGASWRSLLQFSGPQLWLMPIAAYTAWRKAADKAIERQREACMHGKGCAHISRFLPRYAPPKGAIDCGVTIPIRAAGPSDGPSEAVDAFRVARATRTVCQLTRVGKAPGEAPPGGGGSPPGRSRWILGLVIGLLAVLAGAWVTRWSERGSGQKRIPSAG